MRSNHVLQNIASPIISGCLALVLSSAHLVNAQETLVYSFEPDLEGFTGNGPITLSQETSGLGNTHGSNSLKVVHARFNGFAGAITMNLPEAFPTDPDDPGIDFVRYDLTLTSRFAPAPTEPPPTNPVPTFADMSVTFFGTLPGNPVPEAQIQYVLDQKEVGSFEAGTYTLEIDLRNGGGDGGIGAGLNVDTGVTNGYDGWIDAGFVPIEFQIYSNKSISGTDPAFEWTFYIDNVRVGRDVEPVLGDFDENGKVDVTDYITWRMNESANSPLPNDNGVATQAERYNLWTANFGEPMSGGGAGSLAGVPEPSGGILLAIGCAAWYVSRKGRKARLSA